MNCIPNRLVFLTLVISSSLSATTINVPADYSTIQAALTAADSSDTVLVQPGTYYENIIWPDVNGIRLISAGDSSNTIIDGGANGSVIHMNPSSATIDSTTEIRGFQITNGGNIANGGGMFVSNASPVLAQLWITSNEASNFGGGLYISGGSPILTDVTVTGNMATTNGGGFYIDNGSPILTDVAIMHNTTPNSGGGLFIKNSSNPTLTNVTVNNNTAIDGSGGGLSIWSSSTPTLTNVIVSGNVSGNEGGGISISGGNATLMSVTVSGNTAPSGGGIFISNITSTLTDVTVSGNVAGIGGGFFIQSGSPTLANVTVTNNRASGDGGGLFISFGSPTLADITVTNNRASGDGGGLFIVSPADADTSRPTLTNMIVTGNTANNGGGLYILRGSLTLVDVTITGNNGGIYVESGTPTIAGSNIAFNGIGFHNADNTNIVDAADNWWGDSSGPYHPQQNPGGLGDSVNAFVDIMPFLTEPDTAAPPIPVQNLVVTNQGDDFIELAWDASPIGDLAGYRIYLNGDSTGFPYADTIDVGNTTAYTLSNLEPGLTYYIAATCYDMDGNESWYSREVAASVSLVPRIAVSPSTIDFDATMVGDAAVESLQVSNTGTAELIVSQLLSGGHQFVANPESFTVPVGGHQDVIVSFVPTSYGLVSDTLSIISDAFNDPNLSVLVQGFGDLPEAPVILSIVDVDDPPDQGGHVRITFSRSKYDGLDTSQAITEYSLWRLIEGDSWDGVGQFNAVQDSLYNFVAPTLCDSTWEGICWSIFKVTAHTQVPEEFYTSAPDSGYSVDNIAPGVPTGLYAVQGESGVIVAWNPSQDQDFQFYALYRSTQDCFNPDTMETFFAAVEDTIFLDVSVHQNITYFYRVSAFDYAGNESDYTETVSGTFLKVHTGVGIPDQFALYQNYPNPFNPTSTIQYDLPELANVTLVVYDILGREVITLVDQEMQPGYHRAIWDARDHAGRTMPTGIYIARIVTPEYARSIKMLLLK